jgi:hypothetical protein
MGIGVYELFTGGVDLDIEMTSPKVNGLWDDICQLTGTTKIYKNAGQSTQLSAKMAQLTMEYFHSEGPVSKWLGEFSKAVGESWATNFGQILRAPRLITDACKPIQKYYAASNLSERIYYVEKSINAWTDMTDVLGGVVGRFSSSPVAQTAINGLLTTGLLAVVLPASAPVGVAKALHMLFNFSRVCALAKTATGLDLAILDYNLATRKGKLTDPAARRLCITKIAKESLDIIKKTLTVYFIMSGIESKQYLNGFLLVATTASECGAALLGTWNDYSRLSVPDVKIGRPQAAPKIVVVQEQTA